MKPVDQTRDGETGNCYAAALASLLEVPLEVMPDIVAETMHGHNWHGYINTYLSRHHQLMAISIDQRLVPCIRPVGWHLISGVSPRNPDHAHAVVGCGGAILHDPHPSRAGVSKVYDYTFLVPVDSNATRAWLERCPCICPACTSKP